MPLEETLGRRRKAMNWSQENCLTNNRRKMLENSVQEPASDGDGDFAQAPLWQDYALI